MASSFTELRVNITGDGRGFATALGTARTAANNFSNQIKGQFAHIFGVAFLMQMVRGTALWASRMTDLATEVGLSTTELQAFEYAALQTGVSIDQITRAMGRLGMARNEALEDPTSRAGEALDKIFGFTSYAARKKFLEAKTIGDLYKSIAEQFNTKDFGGAQVGLLRSIFGTAGPRLLKGFQVGLPALMKEAEEKGAIASPETLNKLDAAVNQFMLQFMKLRSQFAEGLATMLDKIVDLAFEFEKIIAVAGSLAYVLKEFPNTIANAPEDAKSFWSTFWESIKKYNSAGDHEYVRKAWADAANAGATKDFVEGVLDWDEVVAKALEYTDDAINDIEARQAEAKKNMAEGNVPNTTPEAVKFNQATRALKQGDELARIGGFVGASNRFMSIQEQQLSTQKTIAEAVKKGIPKQI